MQLDVNGRYTLENKKRLAQAMCETYARMMSVDIRRISVAIREQERMLVCLLNKETDHGQHHEIENLKSIRRAPWSKGKLIGAKPPLRPSHVWSIRTKLQIDQSEARPCIVQPCHRQ